MNFNQTGLITALFSLFLFSGCSGESTGSTSSTVIPTLPPVTFDSPSSGKPFNVWVLRGRNRTTYPVSGYLYDAEKGTILSQDKGWVGSESGERENPRPLALSTRLTEGYQFIRAVENPQNGEEFAVIGQDLNQVDGTGTYRGASEIRVVDKTQDVVIEDLTGESKFDVDFKTNTWRGLFTITDGTRTQGGGPATVSDGGKIIADVAPNRSADIRSVGLEGVQINVGGHSRALIGGMSEVAGTVMGQDPRSSVAIVFTGKRQ